MADVEAPIGDSKEQIESNTNGVKLDAAAEANEEVKVQPEVQEAVKVEAKDVKDEREDDKKPMLDNDDGDEVDTKSPDNKRKYPPVSAHERERYERKRPRGGHLSKSGPKIASRFDELDESNDPDEIRRQVEFYFSDSNLPIDAYLLSETGGPRNRPVELKTIHNFKRMRHFQPYSAVRDAVAQSNFLNLNDDDEITRKIPLDEKFTDDPSKNRTLVHTKSMTRSIYAKGFGDEDKNTHLNIEAFFAPYGPISSVRLRRQGDGAFKGSVFVEFESEDAARAFLELDPIPQYNDNDLEVMSKQEYVDLKHEGIMDGLVKPKSPRDFGNNGKGNWRGRDDRRGDRRGGDRDRRRYDDRRDGDRDRRGSKGKFDRDDWKTRRERDQADDRRGGFGGRGRGRDNRGGRNDRGGGRRPSVDELDKLRDRRGEYEKSRDEDKEVIKAEKVEVKTDEDAGELGGDANGGAEEVKEIVEVKENGDAAEAAAENTVEKIVESKKRALEEVGAEQGESKKVKAEEAA